MPHSHRAWVEVDAHKLKRNLHTIKKILPDETSIALVVKADAYGHGMKLISQYCEQERLIDFFCVAHLSEALALRTQGIITPILVMCTLDGSIEDAIMQEIDLTVSNRDQLHRITHAAQKLQKNAHIHIKIDTGLARFGFFPAQIDQIAQEVKQAHFVILCGVFSHFAQSAAQDQTYTTQQRLLFIQCIQTLKSTGVAPTYIHQQNSAGIITQQNALYNMVRVGALAYGQWSSAYQKAQVDPMLQKNIQQVLSFKSRIIEIKELPAGSAVGYDGIFITKRPTRTAKIPVGYADGYNRHFGIGSDPTYIYVNGHYAPIIGHISMNIIIIDITDIPNACVGDVVTLIGDRDGLRANDLSTLLASGNPREVTTQINPLIPRLLKE